MVVVHSFGHVYREQIDRLYRKYAEALKDTGKQIGLHYIVNEQSRHLGDPAFCDACLR